MNANPIIKEVELNAPVSKVWKALTDADEMRKWYFDLKEFNPVVGFEFHFFGGPPEKSYKHVCRITEVISEKKLTYSWCYEGEPGESFVTFELFNKGNRTGLKLTHTGLETFTSGNPHLDRKNFEQGWREIIDTNLTEYFEKIK